MFENKSINKLSNSIGIWKSKFLFKLFVRDIELAQNKINKILKISISIKNKLEKYQEVFCDQDTFLIITCHFHMYYMHGFEFLKFQDSVFVSWNQCSTYSTWKNRNVVLFCNIHNHPFRSNWFFFFGNISVYIYEWALYKKCQAYI